MCVVCIHVYMGEMCVYMCVIYERLLFGTCICTFLCVCTCACVCAQEYVHMYFMYACVNKYVYIYIHTCVLDGYNSMCVFVHLCVACVSVCVLHI